MDITPDLSATVLEAVPAGCVGEDIHQITGQVRLEYPAIRITEVTQILLALRQDGKVRIMGTGETRRYARRV
ncbi:MAG TPA: hypothetical protein VFU47_10595 [Armatimonadota bacterium]|nr:hypothetical protein [Armatimonadota bacterium]